MVDTIKSLVVWAKEPKKYDMALKLSEHLGVPCVCEPPCGETLMLVADTEGLMLSDGELTLMGDFTRLLRRLKPNNLNGEFLVKAAKLKNKTGIPLAIDATAGLGEDALLLAAVGFEVRLYEYDPIIAALLRDALERAMDNEELRPMVERMTLFEEDSIAALQNYPERPDLVLLDPMFPERQKSALIKKKFQLLQQLERPCADEEALLNAAISAKPLKIIIKRPLKGPILAGIKPSYSLSGKAIRYDCLVLTTNLSEDNQN